MGISSKESSWTNSQRKWSCGMTRMIHQREHPTASEQRGNGMKVECGRIVDGAWRVQQPGRSVSVQCLSKRHSCWPVGKCDELICKCKRRILYAFLGSPLNVLLIVVIRLTDVGCSWTIRYTSLPTLRCSNLLLPPTAAGVKWCSVGENFAFLLKTVW